MKKVLTVAVVLCMMCGVVGGVAMAKSYNCSVTSVGSSDKVKIAIIKCDVDNPIKEGDDIKVKIKSNETAIEGC